MTRRSSIIQTLTVGPGISPGQPRRARGLSPPVGNLTRPRRPSIRPHMRAVGLYHIARRGDNERARRMHEAGRSAGGACASRLLKNDASPRECTGYAQGKDAGSARSSATGATEDAAWRRPVHSRGRGLVLQQPPTRRAAPAALPRRSWDRPRRRPPNPPRANPLPRPRAAEHCHGPPLRRPPQPLAGVSSPGAA